MSRPVDIGYAGCYVSCIVRHIGWSLCGLCDDYAGIPHRYDGMPCMVTGLASAVYVVYEVFRRSIVMLGFGCFGLRDEVGGIVSEDGLRCSYVEMRCMRMGCTDGASATV